MGVVALSASMAGVLYEADVDVASTGYFAADTAPASGPTAVPDVVAANRRSIVSRSSPRIQGGGTSQRSLVAAAEKQSIKRESALKADEVQAAAQSARIQRDQWTLPVAYVALTARFGDFGLWASSHTGLDFNGDEGDPIYSVANGTITAVGYDGAYGNKTVVTLEDGTEIWYAHQSTVLVGLGDEVRGGDQIGTIGSTGNVTGSHLHLEVRPAGGDPIDPFTVFASKGLL
jgi:murein DD-endopeptidase MepM/ murein hydrolase activator NlpD